MKEKNLFLTILTELDACITGCTLVLCTIIVNMNVFSRYLFSHPLNWGSEVATSLFVWTVFIGSAYAYRKKAHLGVDVLVNILPESVQRIVKVIVDLCSVGVLVMLTYVSSQYVLNTLKKMSDVLRVPTWYTSIAVPIGFGLSLIWAVIYFFKDLMELVKGGSEK